MQREERSVERSVAGLAVSGFLISILLNPSFVNIVACAMSDQVIVMLVMNTSVT